MLTSTFSKDEIEARQSILDCRDLISKATQDCVDLSFDAGGVLVTVTTAVALRAAFLILTNMRAILAEVVISKIEESRSPDSESPI